MRKTQITAAMLASAVTLGLAACGSPEEPAEDTMAEDTAMAEPMEATAMLMTAEGDEAGTVTATQEPDGVRLAIEVENLQPGMHGAHIHDVGTCEPNFMESGPHWAPFDEELNLADDDDANDSENAMVEVGEDGTGSLEYTLSGPVDFDTMMAGDGSSFMIHARPDDPSIDVDGENGDRLACGVFESASAGAMMDDGAMADDTETM